jgi:copper resistance protein D
VLIALALCRLVHFAATMALFGAGAFMAALAPARLTRDLGFPVRRFVAAAILAAALSAVVWLGLEAALMGEGWADAVSADLLSTVLTETAFGRLWQWRLGLVALMLIILALRRHDRWPIVALATAPLLASLGLAGHAVMQAGLVGALHQANDALHLLATGSWLGGLFPFILCVGRFGDPVLRPEAMRAAQRFSTSGHFVVALVVLTGVVNVALTLGVAPIPFASPYQTLLAAKILVVVLMIATALFNRYVVVPRLGRDDERATAALRFNSIAEAALAVVAVALVSAFGLLPPA